MKKTQIPVLALALILLFLSCSKKDNKAPNTITTTTNTNPYYFRFTLNGKTDTLYDNQHYAYTTNSNAIYGDVAQSTNGPAPYFSLWLGLPYDIDTLTESDVLNLAGKTLYFTDTAMAAQIEYQESIDSNQWESLGFVDSSYNVKISGVTFLDTTRYQGLAARRYVITGTCKARMEKDFPTYIDTPMTGAFNMIITRVVYK
jgi:hypothetical protein